MSVYWIQVSLHTDFFFFLYKTLQTLTGSLSNGSLLPDEHWRIANEIISKLNLLIYNIKIIQQFFLNAEIIVIHVSSPQYCLNSTKGNFFAIVRHQDLHDCAVMYKYGGSKFQGFQEVLKGHSQLWDRSNLDSSFLTFNEKVHLKNFT